MRPVTRQLPQRLASRSLVGLTLALATLIGIAGVFAAPGEALATIAPRVAACPVNLRTSASTTASLKTTIKAGTTVSIASTVRGARWKAKCAGGSLGDDHWARISAINGKSVKSLYGRTYLYGAASMFNWPTPGDRFARCNAIPLRTGTSQATTKKGSLKIGAKVTVVSRVSGGKYGGTCQGIYETGTYWFRVKAINGTSVRTLYGVSYVYIGSAYVGTNPPAGRTEGIDVSHWQGTIDWTKVRAAGKRFAFIKASDGQTYDDPNYTTNRTNAKAAGLLVGAYHFAKPDTTTDDATKEADHFIATAQWTAGELKPVLDLEQSGSMAVADLQTWVKTFLSRIYSRTGVRAVIYVSPYFWTKYMGDTDWFAKNGYDVLWIAHWTTASGPSVSATNWGGNGWTFWQYTSDGSVPGIGGRVDLDRYNGYDFSKVLID